MDCKKALTEAAGDLDQAVDILRKKGAASAAKKASRMRMKASSSKHSTGRPRGHPGGD